MNRQDVHRRVVHTESVYVRTQVAACTLSRVGVCSSREKRLPTVMKICLVIPDHVPAIQTRVPEGCYHENP